MKETLDFISIVPWTSVIMVLNVLILYKIIRKLLFKPVQEMFRKREEEVQLIYKSANDTKLDAENQRKLYQAKLDNAEQEIVELKASAKERIAKEESHILQTAKQEADQVVLKAHEDVELIRKQAADQIKQDTVEIAIEIASNVIQREIAKADHERFIDGSIQRLKEEMS